MFDTHTHLYDDAFENQEAMIKSCLDEGLTLLIPGDTFNNSLKALDLSEKFEGVYCAFGIHPLEIKDADNAIKIKDYAGSPKVKAIGEIGLDYYWIKDKEEREKQKKLFIKQLLLANKLELPVIVHNRDAHEDTYLILKQYFPKKGCVLHCYSGSVEMMEEFIKLGCYIGIDGPVTFKNAKTPVEVALKVPLDRLLVETDSPYLAPVPNRGKRNDSKNLKYIIGKIAEIRNMSFEEIDCITETNARRFFEIE